LPQTRKGRRGDPRDRAQRSRGTDRSGDRARGREGAPRPRARGVRPPGQRQDSEGLLADAPAARSESRDPQGGRRGAGRGLVRFWDTSAIVPLCVTEPASAKVRRLLDADSSIVVWWATRVECLSALARRRRDGLLGAPAEAQARRVLVALAGAWSEVVPSERLRQRT